MSEPASLIRPSDLLFSSGLYHPATEFLRKGVTHRRRGAWKSVRRPRAHGEAATAGEPVMAPG